MFTRFAATALMGRRMLTSTPVYRFAQLETVNTFLRVNPLQNNLAIQNMREMILSKRDLVESDLSELVPINDLINMILRGTISVKSIRTLC